MTDHSEKLPDPDAEIRRLRASLGLAERRAAQMERRVGELQAELGRIYTSSIWRVTAPLRRMLRHVARLRHSAISRLPAPVVARSVPLPAAREAFRQAAKGALDSFLLSHQRLHLPPAEAPSVSIVLVLFNQAALTLACLRSIAAFSEVPAEVIVVDNASSDETALLLERVDGARVIRNAENRHFLHGVNQAAAIARGGAILLLNNDATLREGSLPAALATLRRDDDIGAVGGPIVLPDGTLQEAGSIVWNDGTCAGYGRGSDPGDPEYQFERDVDYCSGAFLLVRREVWEQLSGFDMAFAPAYYEETDFCMRMHAAGWRVVYDPRAIVDHFEFASSSSSDQALALQKRNHLRFRERHRAALATRHVAPGTPPLLGRTASRSDKASKGRVLVIDDRVPFPSLGAGYPRAAALLCVLDEEGWEVTFYPLLFPQDEWAEIYGTLPRRTEVILDEGVSGLARFLVRRAGFYDTIIVSRPHNFRILLNECRGKPDATLVYDAEAIEADREISRLLLAGTPVRSSRRRAMLDEELALARIADRVIAVSQREADLFRRGSCPDVQVLAHQATVSLSQQGFADRADLLFVGALDDDPSPNTDSMIWFINEIMPRLDAKIGTEWRLLIAGRCRAERLNALAGPRVRLLGRVDDLVSLYDRARVFIAPTRYAAGIPLKVLDAAAHGIPVVATKLLADQLGWAPGTQLLAAGSADEFSEACALLYRDHVLWRQVRDAAAAKVSADCDHTAFRQQVRSVMAPVMPRAMPANAAGAFATVFREWRSSNRGAGLTQQMVAAGIRMRRTGGAAMVRSGLTQAQAYLGRHGYKTWRRLFENLGPNDVHAIRKHIACFNDAPDFGIIISDPREGRALQNTISSLRSQIYARWTLHFCSATPASDQFLALHPNVRSVNSSADATGKYLIWLAAGDVLPPHALYCLAAECEADPDAPVIFADEDVPRQGKRVPRFFPEWSQESIRDPRSFGGLYAFRRDLVVAAGGPRRELGALRLHELALRLTETLSRDAVRHVPRVLVHRAEAAPTPDLALFATILREHFERVGESAEVRAEGALRIVHPVPARQPLVSVVIPTRDEVGLLRRCMAGLLEKTDYQNLEIFIVDNASAEPVTKRYFEEMTRDPRVRIVPYEARFNYAAMNNRAIAKAGGDILLLMNNDVSVREPLWLREMVSQVLRPRVGAVGAKLLYGNGTIQHAGVITGITGVAGHPFRHAPADATGYEDRLLLVQDLSCVTAACMAVKREAYEDVGGLDEGNLPVSYNDVDFCLRLRERGWRVLWTPHAILDHLESVTRGDDANPENAARARREWLFMRERWGERLDADPAYSPNLTLMREDMSLAFPPRRRNPWQSFL